MKYLPDAPLHRCHIDSVYACTFCIWVADQNKVMC